MSSKIAAILDVLCSADVEADMVEIQNQVKDLMGDITNLEKGKAELYVKDIIAIKNAINVHVEKLRNNRKDIEEEMDSIKSCSGAKKLYDKYDALK